MQAAARLIALLAGAYTLTGAVPMHQGFDVEIPVAPSPVRVGSRMLLAHELHLTNFSNASLRLQRIEITDAGSGAVLLELSEEALLEAIGQVGRASSRSLTVSPGARVVIYADVAIDKGPAPVALVHAVSYFVDDSAVAVSGTIGTRVVVDGRSLPRLDPPLRGGNWTAVYDPTLARGHRRVVYAVDGKARIPGRFAIDWMYSGPKTAAGQDGGLNAEVLAVADGIVASIRDGVPEPAPGDPRPQVGIGDATGNYVSINIGGGRFAFYEHLMPGLLVKLGQHVRRGQVIGRLGSTGQAWRPHLHFHLAAADSPLAAEGLPYVMTDLRMTGRYRSIAAFERDEPCQVALHLVKTPTFPQPNAVFDFGTQGTTAPHCANSSGSG